MVICRSCGTESPDGFRFCPSCGTGLPDTATPPRQARKIVTALFCDVTGSTALGEELDPEVLRGVMNRYFSEMRASIERHGGTVEKFIGDAVMAVFGIPLVQEDDALRAVRAAAEIRERLPAIAAEVGVALRLRTGVNTGPVLSGEGENLAIGDAINVAARLEQAAAPGEIVLGPETLELVRDAVEVEALEPMELKGKSEPLLAYRLVAIDPVAAGVARHMDAPLVGRERELHLLTEAWDRAVRDSGCHLFTLLGPAGVGKSRLVAELLSRIEKDATVLRGRCLHYGEGITFWPLVEALVEIGDRAGGVLERLEGGGAATPEELFWEVRRLLESLAGERPLILHVDDLQWAEAMLLDLLDHVADLSRGAPILLLCTARPELLEERPGWGGGKLNATTVLLEPLDAAESRRLLAQLGDDLDPPARERVIAASEGNPLFLEEMVALARDRGAVAVPSTIQALLAARLERLGLPEREVLERGAVEGEVFHRLAIRALGGNGTGEIEPQLAALVRKELIRPHPPTLQGDDAFRFRHLLIRDAAYDGLPKATRAELHQRFARWLEQIEADLPELDEIAGWHLEQATLYARELGLPPDRDVSRSAAEHLYAAGERARDRGDGPAARNLLERALALAPEAGEFRASISVELAEQLVDTGELDLIDELLSGAEQEPALAALATLTRFEWLIRARPQEATRAIESRLPQLLEEFHRTGNERGLARAHMAGFLVDWLGSRARPAGEQAALAARHAERAGNHGMRARALGWYIATMIYSDQSRDELARELDAVELASPGPYLAGWIDIGRGELAELDQRFEEAVHLIQRSIGSFEAMGAVTLAGAGYQVLGRIEMTGGNLRRALAALRRGDDVLAEIGERSFRSTTQALLAELCEKLGDRDGAQAAIALSEKLGAAEDVVNYVITHGVRARLALRDGDHESAERWARSAVRYAFQTDFYLFRASSKMVLAQVLEAAGDKHAASVEAKAALAGFEAKGDRPHTAQARALLAGLAG